MIKDIIIENFYIYQIDDGGCGLVKAENKESAKTKIVSSYNIHGQPDLRKENVKIFRIDRDGYIEDDDIIEIGWHIDMI